MTYAIWGKYLNLLAVSSVLIELKLISNIAFANEIKQSIIRRAKSNT